MNQLTLFAKYWEPGRVKTRLAADLGAAKASELYRHFVTTLLRRLESCGDRRHVAYTPPRAEAHFQRLVANRGWGLRPQADGDLGTRMCREVTQSLQAGATAIVIMGTDSPSVPVAYVQQAFDALRRSEVVLGPSSDGGYYLVGLRRRLPELFEGIEWSTTRVWQQTTDRLATTTAADSFEILPIWYDVDDLKDLQRLTRELAAMTDRDEALMGLLRQLRRLAAS